MRLPNITFYAFRQEKGGVLTINCIQGCTSKKVSKGASRAAVAKTIEKAATDAFIATALLKLLDLYPFSFIYEIKTEEFTHQLTNQLIWISLNQGANST